GRPRHSDLLRTLRTGIEGSSMPSFRLLPEAELERLADCVTHLSLRGEVEYRVTLALLNDSAEEDVAAEVRSRLKSILRQWLKAWQTSAELATPSLAEDEARLTPQHLDSVRRGYRLFTESQAASCVTCHEDFGRKAKPRYDVWGSQVRPADLT